MLCLGWLVTAYTHARAFFMLFFSPILRQQVSDAVLEGVFRTVDADGGGTISFDEMAMFIEEVDEAR